MPILFRDCIVQRLSFLLDKFEDSFARARRGGETIRETSHTAFFSRLKPRAVHGLLKKCYKSRKNAVVITNYQKG